MSLRDHDDIGDDRLLGLALGTDDDPGLQAAVAASPELQARLAALADDVAALRDGLSAAVPPPPADYADPAAPRWSALQPYFAAPAEAPARRRRRSPLALVLGPVLGLALALAIVVALQPQLDRSGQQRLLVPKGRFSVESATPAPAAATGAPTDAQGAGRTPEKGQTATVLDLAGGYRTVLVARAGEAGAGSQPMTVLRVLKGQARSTLRLRLSDQAGALQSGAVVVVYLDPVAGGPSSIPSPSGIIVGAGGAASPGALPPPSGGYRARGGPVLVQMLPPGVDPAQLALP